MKKFKIVVFTYGMTITAVSDGTEAGTVIDAEDNYINMIKSNIRRGVEVNIAHSRSSDGVTTAGYDSPLALAAALCSFDENGSMITEAPDEVFKFIRDNMGGCSRFIIEDFEDNDEL